MAKTKGDAIRCMALTKKGERCKKDAREGQKYCIVHTNYEPEHENEPENDHSHSNSESEAESHSHSKPPSQSPVLIIPPAPVRLQVPTVSRTNVISPYMTSPVMSQVSTPVSGLHSESPQKSQSRPAVSNTPSQSITTGMTSSSAYSTVEYRIEALENAIRKLLVSVENNNMTSSRKSRQSKPWTNEKAVEKAKFIFYHERKKDADIIEAVRGGLEQGNMLVFRSKKVGDTVTHTPNIHWQLIKDATDLRFETLAPSDKDVYIRRAWDEYHRKRAGL